MAAFLGFCNLPFDILRIANMQRLPLFKNRHGTIAHNSTDGSDWSLNQWVQAIAGELGEYANFRKKFDRADLTEEEYRFEAAKELADVLTYADILGARLGIEFKNILTEDNFGAYQLALHDAWNGEGFAADSSNFLEILLRHPGQVRLVEPDQYAETLGIAVFKLGALSKEVCSSRDQGWKARLCPILQQFVDQIFALAVINQLDLGQAVVNKFNNVSTKIDVKIYLRSADNMWFVSDLPF